MNMKSTLALLSVLPFLLFGCSSKLNDPEDLPAISQLHGVHDNGYAVMSSPQFHGNDLRNKYWDMSGCMQCHAADYGGGITGQSCNASGCHSAADGGPEACYTCHGDPVKKLLYPQEPVSHKTHIEGGHYSSFTMACNSCHIVPDKLMTPGHIGGTNPYGAEVFFTSALANVKTKGAVGAPFYDSTASTCRNVYCHGNFTNGNNYEPNWKKDNQGKCGTCHGNPTTGNPLPTSPHTQVDNCSICHAAVVDANKNIIDKKKHIDGILHVFGSERTDW